MSPYQILKLPSSSKEVQPAAAEGYLSPRLAYFLVTLPFRAWVVGVVELEHLMILCFGQQCSEPSMLTLHSIDAGG